MAVSDKSLNLLAKYMGGIETAPTHVNIARQILLGSQIDWTAANYKPKGSGKSVVSRIFDILSRGNYAAANVLVPALEDLSQHHYKQAFKDVDILDPSNPEPTKRLLRGISGKDKATFIDAFVNDPKLQQGGFANWSDKKKAIAGLVFDVALDPTTYVGPGTIGKLGIFPKLRKGAKLAEVAPKISEEVPRAAEQQSRAKQLMDAVAQAKSKLPQIGTAVPGPRPPHPQHVNWPETLLDKINELDKKTYRKVKDTTIGVEEVKAGHQAYRAEFKNAMRYAEHMKKLGHSPQFYGQVQRAEQLLARIRDGDPQAIARVAPKAPIAHVATHAERMAAIDTARNVARKLVLDSDKYINPKQQLIIFSHLLKQTVGGPINRMVKATAMMREAEKFLESQHLGFKYWDGTKVKLTQIFDELGSMSKIGPDLLHQLETNRINFPPLDQAVEALRARSVMQDSKYVELALSQVTDAGAKAEALATPARTERIYKGLARDLTLGLKGARVSPAAQKTAQQLFNNINKSRITQVQQAMNNSTKVAHDIMNAKATRQAKLTREEKINHAIEQHMRSPYRVVARSLGNNNQAIEYLGERFATHYGQSTVRPIAQTYLLSAVANAARRSKLWSNVVKSTTSEARREALSAAQGLSRGTSLPPANPRLTNLFRDSIERLFSSTGIKDTAASVATRAAFTMKDINAELRRIGSAFQFTNGKITDKLGNVIDYSKNVDWLKSWETFELPAHVDPVEFVHQLETAAEKVSKRYALLDEVAARFSTVKPTGVYRHLVDDPRLAGRYFTKEMAVQINRMNETFKNTFQTTNSFIKFVDKVTSAWKSGVTIYAPSHHIRNLIGDAWMSWIAGVNNPDVYRKAAKVLRANKGRYSGSIEAVEQLTHPDALIRALQRGETPGVKAQSVILRTKSGIKLTAEQIYIAAHQRGLLLSAKAIEDIYGEQLFPKLFGGKIQQFARGVSENREHYVRLAHFIDSISKDSGKDLKSVFDNAAHNVRKWHPDGMDLTNFEQRYMRRIFPFYSWTRKAFPLVLEAMVMKPGKVVLPAKVTQAIQTGEGIDTGRDDLFPSDQMFPAWIKEKGIGPIAATGGPLAGLAALSRQGPEGGYTMLNPSNPMMDIIGQFGGSGRPKDVMQGIGGMLNPVARVPIEVATDKQLGTGVPVSYDPNQYATQQIPGGAILSRLTNMGILGPTKRGENEGLGNTEAIINYLTAAGLQGTGPYIKQAQYESWGRNKKLLEEYLKRYGAS
jgi:hypothetical protein